MPFDLWLTFCAATIALRLITGPTVLLVLSYALSQGRSVAAVTALNPKSIALFIAFVPQFVNPDQPLLHQFASLITTLGSLAAINAMAYAMMADKIRQVIGRPSVIAWLTRTGGATLILMGYSPQPCAALKEST